MKTFTIKITVPETSTACTILAGLSPGERETLVIRAAERRAKRATLKNLKPGERLKQKPRRDYHDDGSLPPVDGFLGYDDSK